jgi:hypothetical protein
MPQPRLLLAALLSLVSAAVAAAPDDADRTAALAQYQRDLVSVLALRGDAGHLLGAALLARPLKDQRTGLDAAHLLARAASAGDSGPAVSWMRLTDCDADKGACPNADALRALHEQAPGNAAVWLLDLDNAARAGDAAAERAALDKAAAAGTYDDYAGAALKSLVAAATALPVPPQALAAYAGGAEAAGPASAQAFLAFGLAAMHPRPGLLPLIRLCDPEHNPDDAPALRANCLKLAHTLQWGGSPQARAAGLHLTELLADDDTARQSARNDERDLAWQVRNYSQLILRGLTDQTLAVQMLRLAQNGGSEISLMGALLHRNDISLQAPIGDADVPTAGSVGTVPDAVPAPETSVAIPEPAASTTPAAPDDAAPASDMPAPAATAG